MWNEKSSSSPTAAIGDATATTRSAIPRAKSAIRQPGTGCRGGRASVPALRRRLRRGRSARVGAGRTSSSSAATARPRGGLYARPVGGEQTYEAAGRLDREGRRGRRAAPRGRRVDRRERASARSPGLHPLDDDRLPRRVHRLGRARSSILARAARRAPRVRRRPRRALHQRRDHDCGADPLFFLDYVAANRIDLETGRRARRGRRRGLPRGRRARSSAARRRSCPGIYREEELDFAGTCVGLVERDRADRRLARRRRATSSSGCRRRASTRTASRSSAACSSDEDYDGDDLLAPTRLYLDDVRRLRDARRTRSRTSPAAASSATSRASLPDGLARRDRLGRLGAAAGLRVARPARRRGRAAACLQPRDRLLRRRAGSPATSS